MAIPKGSLEKMVTLPQLTDHFVGKKILITGHTGFIGGWLVSVCDHLQANVAGIALDAKRPSLFHTAGIEEICDSHILDILEPGPLKELVHQLQPDYIFHLAAQAIVLDAYRSPALTFETNLMGTVNLLEALRSLEKTCYTVISTTDKVYKVQGAGNVFREGDPLGGDDPYSASKACAELAIEAYKLSYLATDGQHPKPIINIRSGNTIGGGDWANHRIIPDLVRSISADQPIILRHPEAVRSWLHVLDTVYGFLSAAFYLSQDPHQYAGNYNLGSDPSNDISVRDLIEMAINAWGKGTFEITPDKDKDPRKETGHLQLDFSRSKELLSWQPRLSIAEAIDWTVDWYKNYPENSKAITRDQILKYFK